MTDGYNAGMVATLRRQYAKQLARSSGATLGLLGILSATMQGRVYPRKLVRAAALAFLQAGADVEAAYVPGKTSRMWLPATTAAALTNDTTLLKAVAGANDNFVNDKDVNGDCVLDSVADLGLTPDTVRVLLKDCGAAPDGGDRPGKMTPLTKVMLAVGEINWGATPLQKLQELRLNAQILIQYGASVNPRLTVSSRDISLFSCPLHAAATATDTVFLLASGASVQSGSTDGISNAFLCLLHEDWPKIMDDFGEKADVLLAAGAGTGAVGGDVDAVAGNAGVVSHDAQQLVCAATARIQLTDGVPPVLVRIMYAARCAVQVVVAALVRDVRNGEDFGVVDAFDVYWPRLSVAIQQCHAPTNVLCLTDQPDEDPARYVAGLMVARSRLSMSPADTAAHEAELPEAHRVHVTTPLQTLLANLPAFAGTPALRAVAVNTIDFLVAKGGAKPRLPIWNAASLSHTMALASINVAALPPDFVNAVLGALGESAL